MGGNGHVISGTPIAVDMWQKHNCPQARLFFLSHFHTDHMVGLSYSWDFPIYTSDITGELLIKKTGVKPSVVKCLEVGVAHLIPLDYEGNEMLSVTLYNANHCPGSVMFLFQGYFGTVLYTGDFRYIPDLLPFSSLPVIDVLYLDNTYCSSKCIFPKRENAVDDLLNKIHACLHHSKRVFLGLDNLGKEDALKLVAKETHTKIYVIPHRKEILDILGLSDIVTSDKNCAKILVVPTNYISGYNIKKWNSEIPTCGILLTARYSGFSFIPYSKYENIHIVPLSNHSSYEELMEFVKQIRPKAIIPIVGKNVRGIFNTDISERADMSVFSPFLNSSPRVDFTIPKTVQNAMNLWSQNIQATVAFKKPMKQKVTGSTQLKSTTTTRSRGVKFLRHVSSSESSSDSDEEVCDDPEEVSSETERLKINLEANLPVQNVENLPVENLGTNLPAAQNIENLPPENQVTNLPTQNLDNLCPGNSEAIFLSESSEAISSSDSSEKNSHSDTSEQNSLPKTSEEENEPVKYVWEIIHITNNKKQKICYTNN